MPYTPGRVDDLMLLTPQSSVLAIALRRGYLFQPRNGSASFFFRLNQMNRAMKAPAATKSTGTQTPRVVADEKKGFQMLAIQISGNTGQ